MSTMRRIRRREPSPPPSPSGPWPAHVPLLLQRIYAARGAHDLDQARPRLAQLLPPDSLGGLSTAVALLADAIAAQRRILVVGDFDCDGATACAVAVRGLRMLGGVQLMHAVPNRAVHGYGLSPGLVEELAALQPDLLLTVDHGIACHAGVAAAKDRGWQVVVTDHHLPGEALPPADAIVNPNLRGDPFPSKSLAGVGVVFYLLLALRRHLRGQGLLDGHDPDLSSLLDLVAVGTVADLVPLDVNNRALVGAGLRRLRSGQGCAGLQALIEIAGRRAETLTASDIGFGIAPRINAAGRLEDMGVGIECLLTDDPGQARELAQTLHRINAERRGVQQTMVDAAEWHPGVVGLVASKIKEQLHRPAIAFAPAVPGGDSLRGSARSIPGLHIRDVLASVDSLHPGLIERFGGHAMAAGLTLPLAHLAAFSQAFEQAVQAMLDPAILQAEMVTDGRLLPGEFDAAHASVLRDAGPWGQGFPEPLFDDVFDVLGWRIVGERHLKLQLRPVDGGPAVDAIHFGGWQGDDPAPRQHVVFRLEPDAYRGGSAIQLVVEYREPAA
jgi:single-stranded-DNA-specific exonuclease